MMMVCLCGNHSRVVFASVLCHHKPRAVLCCFIRVISTELHAATAILEALPFSAVLCFSCYQLGASSSTFVMRQCQHLLGFRLRVCEHGHVVGLWACGTLHWVLSPLITSGMTVFSMTI